MFASMTKKKQTRILDLYILNLKNAYPLSHFFIKYKKL